MGKLSLYNKIFFIFLATIITSISIVGWFGFNHTSNAYTQLAYDTSYQNSSSIEVAIESRLNYVPKDVLFATDFYALRKFLIWHSMGENIKAYKWKQVFSDTLIDFLSTKKHYYKARVIDLDGNEIINAQYIASLEKTILLDDSELQNKKGRDYIEKTKLLQKGEFYVSAMNLNIEHGEIQKPYIPVVRYATPIIGTNGEVVAVFVINTYAQVLLDIVQQQNQVDYEKGISYYLIDQEGGYLYNKNKRKRWNKQLNHKYNFNEEHFDIKTAFKDENHGSLSLDEKIYSFHKVHPLPSNPDNFWYIVSSIDENKALVKLDDFKSLFIALLFIVNLIVFFIVRFFIRKITSPLGLVTKQLTALSQGKIQRQEIVYTGNDEVGDIVESTQKVVDSMEKIIHQANLVADGDLSKEIKLLSANDQLGLAINTMTRRLQEIEAMAINLSQGNYETNIVAKGSDDKLAIALLEMITYLDTVTKVAESVSKGEIDIDHKAVGSEDRLGTAMLKMIAYLKTILSQANAITEENFSQTIKIKSRHDELGMAMTTMTSILSENSIKNKEEAYFSEGIREINEALTGVISKKELVNRAIGLVTRYVEASTGVLYIYEPQYNILQLEAAFALSPENRKTEYFNLGEGIVGQVGLDHKHILLKNIQHDTYNIQSGSTLGHAKEVFVVPLVHEGTLFGVVEVMTYISFTAIQIDYLAKVASMLATSLHLTEQNTKIKVLLEKSQASFEELQTQSEELQETNIQMEEQQQQLKLQSHELQRKNETLALAKEEIDKRADELEKASRYKSEFLANMSHELRTPLNSIILLSKLLTQNQENNLNLKDIEKVQTINKSGNDLLYLINDILDLTKIESGNMELDVTEVSSIDLLSDMQSLFQDVAQEKKIKLVIEDNFNSEFLIDKAKLAQVIKNLLSNSIKFTHQGQVKMSLEEKEGNLLLIVQDTGIGIPESKLATIFEAFKQVDGSISREFGGTGLGLSICKTLVDLMKGDISVKSVLDEGTSFIISFPLEKGEQVQEESVEIQKNMMTLLHNNKDEIETYQINDELIGKNILIVDDDSRNIFTLTSILESSGMEVHSAFNGDEALEFLNEEDENIDLILMDLMMPVMDGLTAIKTIKSTEEYKDIPIIAVTARRTAEDKEQCLVAGADEYLSKPIEINALFSLMKAWIA